MKALLKKVWSRKKKNDGITISVCVGTGGVAAGGYDVIREFTERLNENGVAASVRKRCAVHKVGCRGCCAKDVLVDVLINGETTTYQFINPGKVRRIVAEHIVGGTPVPEWMVGPDYSAFHAKQNKLLLADCGRIDPEDIDAYRAAGGYKAAEKVLSSMQPEEVVLQIKDSGLRGRGGAGFPTGQKWEACRQAPGDQKYIVCNADEGDPGAFMDRSVIEGNPHSIIEGMIIGAYAIGATRGYVYIRAEYPLAVERLRLAIQQAREKGILGRKVMAHDMDFDIQVRLGAGAFVCGEETALIASLEDRVGEPRPRPPYPVQSGLWGRPTVINNVETLATVPKIIASGAEWFASIGTGKSKGTKIFSLVGKINNTGLVEVPMGISLREIIYDIGGGIPNNKRFKAVQTGGPSGGCIPASHINTPVDYESLSALGSIMGSGGMVIMDEDTCMVDMARFFVSFCRDESCGQCTPCREGTQQMVTILEEITEGRGNESHIPLLKELCLVVKEASLCGLGKTAPNPLLSTLAYFRHEYDAHIYDKKCPAGVCKALIRFTIDGSRCSGCTVCAKNCPQQAITGDKKEPHTIDQEKCIKCGVCYDSCKFNAVMKG